MSRANVLGCAIDRLDLVETLARRDDFVVGAKPALQVSIKVADLVAVRAEQNA